MRYRPGAGPGALRGQQHDATDAARFRDVDDRRWVDLLAAAGDEEEERLGSPAAASTPTRGRPTFPVAPVTTIMFFSCSSRYWGDER